MRILKTMVGFLAAAYIYLMLSIILMVGLPLFIVIGISIGIALIVAHAVDAIARVWKA